jgi:hypothetical protein
MNKPQLMAVNWNTKEMICGTEESVRIIYKIWEDKKDKIKIRVYNKLLWELWLEKPNDGEILNLIDCLQQDRSLVLNDYEEYLSVTEFLFLHDTSFTISNIDSMSNSCTINIEND